MDKAKRVGIVGFGKMGMLHGALINKIDGFEVTAIADTSKIILKAFSSLLPKIKYFQSYQEMMDKVALDVVIITTPSFSHVPIALCAAKKNIHFFMEKPLSNSLENALLLEKALDNKPIIAMVGFHMRYMPTFMKGRELLVNGAIGAIRDVKGEIYVSDIFSPQKGWRYDPVRSGGGIVIDFTVHLLDLMHWYFGKVLSINGQTNKIHSILVEDEAQADLLFCGGLSASIVSSWSVPGYRLPYLAMRIRGEKGEMLVSDHNVTIFDENRTIVDKYCLPDLYSGYYFDIGGPHYSLQMQAFAKAVNAERKTGNLSEALYAQQLVDAFYRSAQQRSNIVLAERMQ